MCIRDSKIDDREDEEKATLRQKRSMRPARPCQHPGHVMARQGCESLLLLFNISINVRQETVDGIDVMAIDLLNILSKEIHLPPIHVVA